MSAELCATLCLPCHTAREQHGEEIYPVTRPVKISRPTFSSTLLVFVVVQLMFLGNKSHEILSYGHIVDQIGNHSK
jgi:hypothetical protein